MPGPRKKGTRPRPARRRASPASPRRPAPSPAEIRILALAREVARGAGESEGPLARRDRVLALLADAFGNDAALTSLLAGAWHRARTDETLTLSLAWVREQLRVSLQEVLEAGALAGVIRKEPPPAVLAWILLAACEGLLREAPGGGIVSTRDLLRALSRLSEPP